MEQTMTDEELEAPLDDETEAQITEALANARDWYDYEVASSASYLRPADLLLIVLKSGRRVAIPVEDIQDLADADRDAVAEVELVGSGSALHWEKLDVDFRVEGLADGSYGNQRWMADLSERRRKNAAAAALEQTA
jgi:hypothetical protein